MVVHGVQNSPDFNEKRMFKRTSIQDVLLHHNGFLVSLEKDEEVRPEQLVVKVLRIRNELGLFDIHLR